uniref:mRNA capping enzyme adenylation domain-containing protein n=1 Tax=Daphnia galeata TaxID=27404 RepID=A0A8J2RDV5_9CRUS|nr:unnamed protein product [Daphnia galeata]
MESERRVINTRGYLGINKPRFSSRSDLQSDWRRPTESDGKKNDQQYISSPQFPGEFLRIDPKAKFLENEQIEGVHLLTDFDLPCGPLLYLMKISTFSHREPYDVVPRAYGTCYFLYVDSAGQIYLENMSQHIFRVDDDHSINMVSSNGRPITDTVLDGVFTRAKCPGRGSSDEDSEYGNDNNGRLTFLIHDAIRCNGVDLTDLNIRSRMNVIQEEVMKQWDKRTMLSEKEAFNLDFVGCKEASLAMDYLSFGFQDNFKYSFSCLVFFPRQKGYKCNTCYDVFQWSESSKYTCNFRLKFTQFAQYKDCPARMNKAELHAVGYPQRSESFFDTIPLTEEIRGLDDRMSVSIE